VTYARVLNDAISSTGFPPDLLEPDDPTADGRWWDLRQHAMTLADWETNIVGPHGWLPIVAGVRPPDTATDTSDYSLELIGGVPTEVWTVRPWTQTELDDKEAAANTTEMVAESDISVDKLIAVIEKLNTITAMTNAAINTNAAAVIKDLTRECKTIARQVNREARLTSGRTEDTDTGPVTDV
jgi:hypothetical protein